MARIARHTGRSRRRFVEEEWRTEEEGGSLEEVQAAFGLTQEALEAWGERLAREAAAQGRGSRCDAGQAGGGGYP